jgi:hypothetical protein
MHFRIRPGHKFRQQEDISFLEQIARKYLGNDTTVTWELVEELKSEPSGKFLFCKSSVSPRFLASSEGVPITQADGKAVY